MEKMDIAVLRISDVDVASTLYTLDIPIDGIHSSGKTNRYNEPIIECYFKRTDLVEKIIDDYYSDALMVVPRTLLNNRKEIISRMREVQRKQ